MDITIWTAYFDFKRNHASFRGYMGLGVSYHTNIPENWILGISPEGAGVIGMALNFIVAIIVARNTAPPPEHIQQLVEDIRIPN